MQIEGVRVVLHSYPHFLILKDNPHKDTEKTSNKV